MFQAPFLIPGVEYLMTISPIKEQPQPSSPIQALPLCLEVLKPLHYEHIEIAVLLCQERKQLWLQEHPNVQPKDYQKA